MLLAALADLGLDRGTGLLDPITRCISNPLSIRYLLLWICGVVIVLET